MAVEHYYPAESGCRHIDVYEKLNRIDEGTFGVVFRVKDKGTGEVFAVKKLKLHKERDGFPITALREINTLLKVNHENIVNVRELVVGDTMDDVFIVMEFVEHDLKALLETMDKPPLRAEVKMLMKQLLCGVAHLHDNWLIHRDLKTSNLLLSHKGILKIADFGLAREFGSPTHNMTQLVVTLWYEYIHMPYQCIHVASALALRGIYTEPYSSPFPFTRFPVFLTFKHTQVSCTRTSAWYQGVHDSSRCLECRLYFC
eukprot:m.33895 g.33895  ORF g.33895 m.33895 type:complete len:257 (-) comp9693_c0_seq1:784-1554(-)